MSDLVLKIRIEHTLHHDWKFTVDCDQLAGSPPLGLGRGVEAAVADWMAQHGKEALKILNDKNRT